MKKYIDLSHPIVSGMPVYPGTPSIDIQSVYSIEQDGFREKEIHISSHTGTHVDAPAHLLSFGKSLDQLNLSSFTGNAIVVPINTSGADQHKALQEIEKQLGSVEFVLFHTGQDKHWGAENYFDTYAVPVPELIKHLCTFDHLKGIGIDAISIDPVGSESLENHNIILSKEMIIIENLTNLSVLVGKQFHFNCFPLPLENGDGSPVRAIAEIDD